MYAEASNLVCGVIEPGCAGSEFQQPSSVAPAETAQVTGNVAERAEDVSYSQWPRPRGDVVDQDRHAAVSHQASQMRQRCFQVRDVMQRRRAEDEIKAMGIVKRHQITHDVAYVWIRAIAGNFDQLLADIDADDVVIAPGEVLRVSA